jgi:subtilase family protein
MRITLIPDTFVIAARRILVPSLALGLLSLSFASTSTRRSEPVRPATETRQVAGASATPVPDPDARPSADAEPRGGGPGNGHTSVKGWLQEQGGGRPMVLPSGTRTIDTRDGRSFVEVPATSLPEIDSLGLEFEPVADADVLNIGGETFDVRDGEPAIAPEWSAAGGAAIAAGGGGATRRPYVVKFDAPIREQWLADLQAAGAEIVQYQPHFGYLLLVPAGSEDRIRTRPHVAFGGEYHPAYKARAELRAKAAFDQGIAIRIVMFDLPGWEERVDGLLKGGARLEAMSEGTATSQWTRLRDVVLTDARTRDLPAILRDPVVYWAEEWTRPRVEDERASQISAGNYSFGVPTTGYHTWLANLGADGTGVTVAVADTGFDTGVLATIHPDLRNRTAFATAICPNSRDQDGHGTNTASIAVGDPRLPTGTGLLDAQGFFFGSGGAPGAHLWVQKAINDGDCVTDYAGQPNVLAADAFTVGGARIGSHSFQDGGTPGNGYTANCALWDARTRDADPGVAGNQPYLVVFSAGNSGPTAGSLTTPHAAKNIITVGATENYRPGQCPGITGCGGPADDIDALIDFSSRGPTVDGRIKPDIAAPGHTITGARSSVATYDCFCDNGTGAGCCASTGVDASTLYTAYSGTSQAAPNVAGAAGVVFDWFKDRFGVFPSPAMAKAILINGAVDIKTADIPNNNEGWGRINLTNSLLNPGGGLYTDQTSILGTTGDPAAYTTSGIVQDPTKPVTATLVWTDPAGAVNCNPCLVNDLDLLVTQGTTTWRGNSFTNGFSNTSATADTRNNVEEVKLPPGVATCTPIQFKVRAQTLNGDGVPGNADTTDQDFALVATNIGAAGVPSVDIASAVLSGGCDADAFLDRRETANLAVGIRDIGCATASGVAATLSVVSAPPGATVTVSPTGAEAIGTIASGATVQHNWQLNLADSASSFCGGKVVLQLAITDGAAHTWTRTTSVTLDVNSINQVTDTDPATIDRSSSHSVEWSLRTCRVTSPTTSWHMGQADCTGIVHDASSQDLFFTYNLPAGASLGTLSFKHAFNGYSNASFHDSVQIDIDPENDGTFVNLALWQQGIDNPTTMSSAGPYDLTPFNATHGPTVKLRFRFQSAANWSIQGGNTAAGWDVDDIVLTYSTFNCDSGSCPICSAPSGLTNNGAADANACLNTGVNVSWLQNPTAWGDAGGTRGYVVLRDGVAIASGPCAGTLPYGTTSCVDTTAVPGASATYRVRYVNGCALSALTSGLSAADGSMSPPPEVGNTVLVSESTGNLTLTWDPVPGATRYNVYMGTIGTWWSHAIFTATGLDGADSCFEPTNSVTFVEPPGDVYFLVAADNGCWESSLGSSTPQTPVPYASPPCSPH